MECTVQRNGTVLSISVIINGAKMQNLSIIVNKSAEYCVCDSIAAQFKHIAIRTSMSCYSRDYRNFVYISLKKKGIGNDLSYSVQLSSPELNMNHIYEVDSTKWRLINETNVVEYSFTLTLKVDFLLFNRKNPFWKLYDNSNLTDFTLKCDDGSIAIHRTVLGSVSTHFWRMVTKENESGSTITSIFIPDTKVETLKDFKKALYMNRLPENNLINLIMLASFFKLKDLEFKCVDKLLKKLKSPDLIKLLDLSLEKKCMSLLLGILEKVQFDELKVDDIRKYYLKQ